LINDAGERYVDETKNAATGGWEVYPDRVLVETPIMTVKVGPV
jgi:hypothetical protein